MKVVFKATHPEDKYPKPIHFTIEGPDLEWIMSAVAARYSGYNIVEAHIA